MLIDEKKEEEKIEPVKFEMPVVEEKVVIVEKMIEEPKMSEEELLKKIYMEELVNSGIKD